MSDPNPNPPPPTAAQVAWLLQQGKLELGTSQDRMRRGWYLAVEEAGAAIQTDFVSDALLAEVPAEPALSPRTDLLLETRGRAAERLRAERDDLKSQLAKASVETARKVNAGYREAGAESGTSAATKVKPYNGRGTVQRRAPAEIHCQCQYDPDE